MSNKEKVRLFFTKNAVGFLCILSSLILTIIEVVLLQMFPEWVFGFTALSLAFGLIKFGAHIFRKSKKWTFLFLGCVAVNIVVLNRLYVYAALVELFPQLRNTDFLRILLICAGLITLSFTF